MLKSKNVIWAGESDMDETRMFMNDVNPNSLIRNLDHDSLLAVEKVLSDLEYRELIDGLRSNEDKDILNVIGENARYFSLLVVDKFRNKNSEQEYIMPLSNSEIKKGINFIKSQRNKIADVLEKAV